MVYAFDSGEFVFSIPPALSKLRTRCGSRQQPSMVQSGGSVPSVLQVPRAARPLRRQRKHVPHHQRPRDLVRKRNTRERRRVHGVNQAFETLRQHVPLVCCDDKTSKISIIRQASSYIMRLTSLLQDIDGTAAVMERTEAGFRERMQSCSDVSYDPGVLPFVGDNRNETGDCEQNSEDMSQEKRSNRQQARVQSPRTRNEISRKQIENRSNVTPSSIVESTKSNTQSSSTRTVGQTSHRQAHVQPSACSPDQARRVWKDEGASCWRSEPLPTNSPYGTDWLWTDSLTACCQFVTQCRQPSCHQPTRSYCQPLSSNMTPAYQLVSSSASPGCHPVTSSVASDYYSQLYARAQPYASQKPDVTFVPRVHHSAPGVAPPSPSEVATTSSSDVSSSHAAC